MRREDDLPNNASYFIGGSSSKQFQFTACGKCAAAHLEDKKSTQPSRGTNTMFHQLSTTLGGHGRAACERPHDLVDKEDSMGAA